MSVRYRTKGGFQASGQVLSQAMNRSCPETAWVTLSSSPGFHTGDFQYMRDTVTAKFHERKAKGEVVFNPLYRERIVATSQPGDGVAATATTSPISCSGSPRYASYRDVGPWSDRCYSTFIGYGWSGSGPHLPPPVDILSGSQLSDLLVECSTKVSNERGRSDFNMWETLAESNKALGTLTGVFKSAAKTFQSLKRGNPLQAVKDVSGGYLVWRYGIKPMISDVESVLEGMNKKTGRMRKSSRAKVTFDLKGQRSLTYNGAVAHTTFLTERTYDRGDIRCMSLDEFILDEFHKMGLSSKGLITVPWELVRLSFVLDWFVNIGDYLGAITPVFGWNNLGSCTVINRERRSEYEVSGSLPKAGWNLDSPASGSYQISRYSRQRSTGYLRPGIVVKSDFRFDKATRCQDAFALLAQQAIPIIQDAFRKSGR